MQLWIIRILGQRSFQNAFRFIILVLLAVQLSQASGDESTSRVRLKCLLQCLYCTLRVFKGFCQARFCFTEIRIVQGKRWNPSCKAVSTSLTDCSSPTTSPF